MATCMEVLVYKLTVIDLCLSSIIFASSSITGTSGDMWAS